MPVLQRSCQACVTAKRRCDLAAPRCARCSTRRISCRYINEPATGIASVGEIRKLPRDSPRKRAAPGSHISRPLRLEVVRSFDAATLHRLVGTLQSLPVEFAQRRATSFLHPYLYHSRLPPSLQFVHDLYTHYQLDLHQKSPQHGTLQLHVGQLLRRAKHASSFTELLAYVQAITLMKITLLLQGRDISADDIERDKHALWALAHRLWEFAPAQLPSTLSPWKAWLLAESVRRTILVCNILLDVHGALRRGYAVHALCIEALPFDMRTDLWDAHTVEAWQGARARSSEPSLVTFRQFRELRQPKASDSSFETLLLLSFKDRALVEGQHEPTMG